MAGPGDAIGAGLAGLGCRGAIVLFVVGLVAGAGFFGSLVMAFVVLLMLGYAASLVS